MEPQTLEQRVEHLERRVTLLEELPARVDALGLQISQLRDEMRAEFSATRSRDEETRRLLLKEIEETRAQMLMLHEDTLSRLALTQEGKPRPRKRR